MFSQSVCQLAMKHSKTFIHYYGIKGHKKDLIDAKSGLSLKTSARKAIVTEDVCHDSAQKVYKFISEKTRGNKK